MRLDDFDYELPEDLIAQTPPPERGASRMLHVDGPSGAIVDGAFRDISRLVTPGDVLVFNDTRVIKARLNGHKASGGRIEVLVERVLSGDTALAQVRASHPPRSGSELVLASEEVRATVVEGG